MARAPAQVGLNREEQTMMNQRNLIKLGAVTVVAVIAAAITLGVQSER